MSMKIISPEPPRDELGLPTGVTRTGDAARLAGVTYRQLDYWINNGHLLVYGRGGSGNLRWLDHGEMRVLRVMKHLTYYGMRPDKAALVARNLADKGQVTLGPFNLTLTEAAA